MKTITTTSTTKYLHPERRSLLTTSEHTDELNTQQTSTSSHTDDSRTEETEEALDEEGHTTDERSLHIVKRNRHPSRRVEEISENEETKTGLTRNQKKFIRRGKAVTVVGKTAFKYGTKLAAKHGKRLGKKYGKRAAKTGGKLALQGSKKAAKAGFKAGKAALPKLLDAAKRARARKPAPCDC